LSQLFSTFAETNPIKLKMKNAFRMIAAGLITCWSGQLNAQRYLTEIFTDEQVSVQDNVVYGQNISVELTVLSALSGGSPVPPDTATLRMDIYEPNQDADVLAERPLVIYLPTGNFLPPVANGSPNGSRKDSSAVNFAKQLAKRGYVCAVVDYRKGWNPVSPNQIVRTGTILNAAYKGQQDSKTAVRFFRNDRAGTNAYKIDPNRIVLLGEGTGGYVAMAHAFLDAPWKIARLPGLGDDKFLRTQNPDTSVVDTSRVGNFDATDDIPLDLSAFAASGDLLKVKGNVANYPNQASNVQLVINMGGALGDTSWIDRGQIPMIGIQAVRDPYAPYQIGDVIVPTTGNIVIPFASGAGFNVKKASEFDNNESFANKIYTDAVTLAAESRLNQEIPFAASTINTGSGKGLLPFILTEATPVFFNHGSPWQFWSSTQPTALAPVPGSNPPITTHQASASSNPFMAQSDAVGREKALLYIDSIQQFIHPRIVCALDLEECNLFGTIGFQKVDRSSRNLEVFPNPANQSVFIRLKGKQENILRTELYNLTGSLISHHAENQGQIVRIDKGTMPAGIYLARIITANSEYTARIIFE
jgi:hypothetical protein